MQSNSFEIPLLSQDVPTRPAMKPHCTVPGPAIEGPAKPGTSEHGMPSRMKLAGEIEGKHMSIIIRSPRADLRDRHRLGRWAMMRIARQRHRRRAGRGRIRMVMTVVSRRALTLYRH
eukprot:7788031-Pyramimonas_sp.AAC.1